MDPLKKAWAEAKRYFAGGVNSPVRAFDAVGGNPVLMERGFGPYLYDVAGRRYVDHCLSWGAILLGHAHEATVCAIQKQASKGTGYGTATVYETALAREIQKAFPGMERMRFTSSGTEAAMSAVRLARGVTNRKRTLKFEGCYHGHVDGLLVKAGSGLATFGSPDSAGVPEEIAGLTSVLPYNDVEALEEFFRHHGRSLACAIVEPIAGNMGVVPADKRFLATLRVLTQKHGALLILDEVITGFRVAYGGAQHLYGVEPDLTVLGKIIGGGLPVGAFGGGKGIMDALSPVGKVYQAGTLSGNPVSMVAGLSVLSRVDQAFYKELEVRTMTFLKDARRALSGHRKHVSVASVGSMFTIFFSARAPRNFQEARGQDTAAFARFFRKMLNAGIYVPPSAFEAWFLSDAHGEAELGKTVRALAAA